MTDSASALASDDAPSTPPITPFWNKLNEFFLFPFQLEPLIWAIGLALLNSVAALLGFLGLLLSLLASFATVFYFFKVASLASRGVLNSKDYANSMTDPDWKWLPLKLWLATAVYVVVAVALVWMLHLLGLLIGLPLLALLLPATVMVLIRTSSLLASINPVELLATATDIGLQYLLLCLFLFLLVAGTGVAQSLLAHLVPRLLLLPMLAFVSICFTWIMAALIGYVMYQHHEALQIDLLREPQSAGAGTAEPSAADVAKAQAHQRDVDVSALVREGKLREALEQAREWARVSYDSVVDEDRYHRVLLFDDPASGRLVSHAQRYLPLLLKQKQGRQALQVFQAVQEKAPGFVLEKPADTLALAEQAWSRQDANQTLAALNSFDKRYPGAAEIPRVYELVIRALKQGFDKSDMALTVYRTLARRYPDHPSTQEAAWVLRQELKTGSALKVDILNK